MYLKTDGSKESFLIPTDGEEGRLEKLQELVGGYIEMITVCGVQVIFNEEGLIKRLDPNPWTPTTITENRGGKKVTRTIPQLVGNVVMIATDNNLSLDINEI